MRGDVGCCADCTGFVSGCCTGCCTGCCAAASCRPQLRQNRASSEMGLPQYLQNLAMPRLPSQSCSGAAGSVRSPSPGAK